MYLISDELCESHHKTPILWYCSKDDDNSFSNDERM